MHILDILIIILLVGFGVAGIRRGMVMEMLVTIGLGLALFFTLIYRHELQDLAGRMTDPGWQRDWGTGLVFLLFFVAIYLTFAYLGNQLRKLIHKTVFKWPDRILGIAAGILKGSILIAMLVVMVEFADRTGNVEVFLNKSRLIRIGKELAHQVTHWESTQQRKWI